MSCILRFMTICDDAHVTRVPYYVHRAAGVEEVFSSVIFVTPMTAKVLLCRLCWESVLNHKVISIFTRKSLERVWPSRISVLLGIPVCRSDQLPPHVCSKCSTRAVTLEKASINLAAFKRSRRFVMEQALSSHKRTKGTTGEDVSPNTLWERPRSKIPRRLSFTSELYKIIWKTL